jgi:hypothetical protein
MHSISFDTGVNKMREMEDRTSKITAIGECNMYICAECNKIITAFDEKFENPKNRLSKFEKGSLNCENKKSLRCSPSGSIKKLSPNPNDDS